MANHWLFKEEPSSYSFEDLESDGATVWNGVRNNLAAKYLRQVEKGDEIFYYHTGNQRAAVGIMRAASDAYPDPDADEDRWVVVDVEPVRRLDRPVELGTLKKEEAFDGSDLVRIPRLSVAPIDERQWKRVLELSST